MRGGTGGTEATKPRWASVCFPLVWGGGGEDNFWLRVLGLRFRVKGLGLGVLGLGGVRFRVKGLGLGVLGVRGLRLESV